MVVGPKQPPHRAGPSLRRGLMIDAVRGQPRARAWPSPTGKAKSKAQHDTREQFRAYQWAAKHSDPRILYMAEQATRGTPLMPRDLLTMVQAGRLYQITFEGERTLHSMAQRQDISESLDILASTPGYMLVRGEQFWEGVPAPAAIGSWFWNQPAGSLVSATNTGARPTKGKHYRPYNNVFLSGVACRFVAVETATYQMHVATLDDDMRIIELVSTEEWVSDRDGNTHKFWPIATTMLQGVPYGILLSRTDAVSSYVLPIMAQAAGAFLLPFLQSQFLSSTKAVIEEGDTLGTDIGGTTSPVLAVNAAIPF